jgi:hypothetical protein
MPGFLLQIGRNRFTTYGDFGSQPYHTVYWCPGQDARGLYTVIIHALCIYLLDTAAVYTRQLTGGP